MATAQYLYAGSGAPAAEVRSGTTRAYQFDGMRSARQMVDTDGSVTDTFGFDLLGNVRSRTGSTPTPFTWNVGAGKTTATTGLFFQDRWKPGRRAPVSGWGTGWDSSGGFDYGRGTRGGRSPWEILNEIISQGAFGRFIEVVVQSGPGTSAPAPRRTSREGAPIMIGTKPAKAGVQPFVPSPTGQPGYSGPAPSIFPGDAGPAGVAFLYFLECIGCCLVDYFAGRIGLPLTLGDCSPRVSPGNVRTIPNPTEIPIKSGTWGDDVFYDWLREHGIDRDDIEKAIADYFGEAADEFFDKLDDWLGKCKKPICFIECGVQFYIDMKEAEVNVDPWQRCGLERSPDDCHACCNKVEKNNRKTACMLGCDEKWGE